MWWLAELDGLSETCHRYDMRLFVDGAHLAYALAADGNDVTLADLSRLPDGRTIVRVATIWAMTPEDVDALVAAL